jgi:hypothetical protein
MENTKFCLLPDFRLPEYFSKDYLPVQNVNISLSIQRRENQSNSTMLSTFHHLISFPRVLPLHRQFSSQVQRNQADTQTSSPPPNLRFSDPFYKVQLLYAHWVFTKLIRRWKHLGIHDMSVRVGSVYPETLISSKA